MSDEIHVVVDDDEVSYRFPSSSEHLATHEAGTVVLVREPIKLPHWRRRLSKAMAVPTTATTVSRGKLIWNSVGVVLLVLQLSALVLSSLRGEERGVPLAACPAHYPQEGAHLSSSSNNHNHSSAAPDAQQCTPDVTSSLLPDEQTLALFNIHLLVDLYFLVDLLVRYRWTLLTRSSKSGNTTTRGRKKDGKDATVARSYFLWFVIDFLLLFPHGVCWKLWEARPALQLLTIKEGRRRPIVDFIFNRAFRLNVLKLVSFRPVGGWRVHSLTQVLPLPGRSASTALSARYSEPSFPGCCHRPPTSNWPRQSRPAPVGWPCSVS